MSATAAEEIVIRAALVIADGRRSRHDRAPLDEAMLDARAVLAEVAPLIEAKAIANTPQGSHCRSCCYLQAPCDEHKGKADV